MMASAVAVRVFAAAHLPLPPFDRVQLWSSGGPRRGAIKDAYLPGELRGLGGWCSQLAETEAATNGARGVRLVFHALELLLIDGVGAALVRRMATPSYAAQSRADPLR
jgi:hypothetical protein